MKNHLSRREFIGSSCLTLATASANAAADDLPAIDIHQHPGFRGRSDDRVIAHQRAMGMKVSFILPAGTPVELPSTNNGKTNRLAAGATPVDTALELVKRHPLELRFFANEVPDMADAKKNFEKLPKTSKSFE